MRLSVKRAWGTLGLSGLLQFAVLTASFSALAEPNGPELISAPEDEIERWVPAVSAALGLLLQKTSGDFETGNVLGPSDPSPADPLLINPAESGKDTAITPVATFSIELMTPGLLAVPGLAKLEVPGRPRLFVHGDVIPSFGAELRTAKNGDPGPNEYPSDFATAKADKISGQGGLLIAQVQTWQFAAGAGIAFSVDLGERRLRIKPSFEYMTEEIQIDGEVRRAVSIIPGLGSSIDDFRIIVLETSETKRFHGIGAGIEFELDTRRAGPVLLSVFAGARGYRFMGDLKMQTTAINSENETATFRFEKKRYGYRASLGIRFRFAPE